MENQLHTFLTCGAVGMTDQQTFFLCVAAIVIVAIIGWTLTSIFGK